MEARELLASIPFFAEALDSAHLDALAARAAPRTYAEGEVILREGDITTELLVISSGEVSVTINEHGSEKQVATLGPGEIIGEMSLLTGAPRAATVTALSPVDGLEIGKPAMRALLRESPHLLERFASTLYQRQTQLDKLYSRSFWDRLAPRREDTVAIMQRFFN